MTRNQASMRPPPKEAEHGKGPLPDRPALTGASMRPPPKEAEHRPPLHHPLSADPASMRPPPKEAEHAPDRGGQDDGDDGFNEAASQRGGTRGRSRGWPTG